MLQPCTFAVESTKVGSIISVGSGCYLKFPFLPLRWFLYCLLLHLIFQNCASSDPYYLKTSSYNAIRMTCACTVEESTITQIPALMRPASLILSYATLVPSP